MSDVILFVHDQIATAYVEKNASTMSGKETDIEPITPKGEDREWTSLRKS